MMAIVLFGFETVYGLITTGNHWRHVCTDHIEGWELNLMPFSFLGRYQKQT
jgi:hypothetical protein